jgi:hypothetical protein
VYVWLWHRLPGGWPGKVLGCLALFLAAVFLLFYVVFPRVEGLMPWNHVTVTPAPSASSG